MKASAPPLPVGLLDILDARNRIKDLVRRTPLIESAWLSGGAGGVYLKLESLQATGSFKLRGALNAVLAHGERGSGRPIVTASAGNHGRALAYAAGLAGIPATIFTPRGAPRSKLDAITRHGARLVAEADDYDGAEAQAKAFAAAEGAAYISPYSDRDVIAGTGTIALELFDELPAVGRIVAPVGGGGLLSGLAIAARSLSPPAEVVGAEAAASPVFQTSLAAGRVTAVTVQPTLADGLAGNLDPETITFAVIQSLIARVISVDETAIADAVRLLAQHEHVIVEGAGAVAVAAIRGIDRVDERPTVAIVSGSNIDLSTLNSVLSR